ncbi:MAG: hypothetical protein IPL61_23120 [Myxococcales bacterium]|nr:hypothetical protein [Myxococcales bacterium]
MTVTRRTMIHSGLAAGAALVGTRLAAAQPHTGHGACAAGAAGAAALTRRRR